MTTDRLDELRKALEHLIQDLSTGLDESAESAAPISPDNAIGRLTRQDAMQAQQLALEMRRRNQSRLQQARIALEKLERGGYGICVRCDEEIPAARLRVRPEAQVCIRCAENGKI